MENDIEINIDGVPISGLPIAVVYQTDPYPGGHQFCLKSAGNDLKTCVPNLVEGSTKPSPDLQEQLFRVLGITLSSRQTTGSIQYVLNSLSMIEYDGHQLELHGICSPVIK